jgi:hypothetical protein
MARSFHRILQLTPAYVTKSFRFPTTSPSITFHFETDKLKNGYTDNLLFHCRGAAAMPQTEVWEEGGKSLLETKKKLSLCG